MCTPHLKKKLGGVHGKFTRNIQVKLSGSEFGLIWCLIWTLPLQVALGLSWAGFGCPNSRWLPVSFNEWGKNRSFVLTVKSLSWSPLRNIGPTILCLWTWICFGTAFLQAGGCWVEEGLSWAYRFFLFGSAQSSCRQHNNPTVYDFKDPILAWTSGQQNTVLLENVPLKVVVEVRDLHFRIVFILTHISKAPMASRQKNGTTQDYKVWCRCQCYSWHHIPNILVRRIVSNLSKGPV